MSPLHWFMNIFHYSYHDPIWLVYYDRQLELLSLVFCDIEIVLSSHVTVYVLYIVK